ncbi:preprotein translocase subunit SecG [bacterium]|nr:preprotein translocase subunit SecG [bacterium]
MVTFLIITHILACFLLITLILLQSGKGTDLASVFGGGSSQSAFGPRRGNILTKITTSIAIIFMITSLSLTISSSRQGSIAKEKGIVKEKVEKKIEKKAGSKKEEVKKGKEEKNSSKK